MSKENQKAIKEVLRSYGYSFLLFFLLMLIWLILKIDIRGLIDCKLAIMIGSALLAGSTLGYLVEWRVRSWGGKTDAEKINQAILIFSYLIGTSLIMICS